MERTGLFADAAWTVMIATAVATVPACAAAQTAKHERAVPPSAVVSAVRIERESVFDQAEELAGWLARAANGLHIVTREHVVARELLVREGEIFDSAAAAETARNLRKLGIFRDVSVDSVRTSDGLAAQITTRDSWTTQVYATYKAGGNQSTWGIGLTEKNLIGSHIKATVRYVSDPDRSSTQFAANIPRVWRNQLGVSVAYADLSDGKLAAVVASAPFLSLSTRHAYALALAYNDANVLRFLEGHPHARDTLRHRRATSVLSGGWAPRASARGYVRLGGVLQLRRQDFIPLGLEIADRSSFGELGVNVEVSRTRFSVVRGYRGLGGPEDMDLSTTARLGVWLAPSSWGYERTGVGPEIAAQSGVLFPGGFLRGVVRATSLFTRKGLDSGSVVSGVVLALQPAPRHSVVFNADVGLQKHPYPGEEFDLGLTLGPRGFPAHAFTGDRAFFTTAEYRWLAAPNLFGLVGVGVAAFVDYGGAWYSGSPRRTGTDAGFGFRLGSTRSSSGKGATRIDFARRFANDVLDDDWVVAIGAGFPFDRR